MGHNVNYDKKYRLLQQRLDRNITGAPESPVFMKILKLLFSPEEAELARKIPGQPVSLNALSKKLSIDCKELDEKLTEMAQKGLVVDLEHKGKRYFVLAPVAIGFFEFTFMRTRNDMPMAELARLFDQYMEQDDKFIHSLFQGQTQVGRSLVREESLPESDHTEILDWERASHIVKSATAVGVSLCVCRHKASLLGKNCKRPKSTCLSLNYMAESIIRSGFARQITNTEAMKILEKSKEAGLAQTGDNVQRKVAYICNCCGCCCEMMQAIKIFDIRNAIVTSNWIMEIDLSKCNGCGKCANACPINAIEIIQEGEKKNKRKKAVCDENLCLGCGVCYSACKFGGITMKPRIQRVYTPETIFDRLIAMAIEREKLADLIFDEPERLSHRAMGRIIHVLENSSPFKAAMSVKPLRSVFLNMVVKGVKLKTGEFTKVIS
ncbi:MAG: 4Fe-4S dicluster domain-containing protein [Desulfobacterales bacterium]|jgi:ferredoxin|nr:4Fe-4S dicluster domain-containing protein [Desulfobacterales bacterium]